MFTACKKESTTNNNNSTTITYIQTDVQGQSIRQLQVEVQNKDLFPIPVNYNKVKNEIYKLSEGWRIPTHDELKGMYLKRDTIGDFKDSIYWGVFYPITAGAKFEHDVKALPTCTFNFKTGKLSIDSSLSTSTSNCYLRLVRKF